MPRRLLAMIRCEAGARYDDRRRIVYECDQPATWQVGVETAVLAVWCDAHKLMLEERFRRAGPKVVIEPLVED